MWRKYKEYIYSVYFLLFYSFSQSTKMPSTRSRRNQRSGATSLLPSRRYDETLRACQDAIRQRNDTPRMPYLFVANEPFTEKIRMAQENYDMGYEQKKIIEYKA